MRLFYSSNVEIGLEIWEEMRLQKTPSRIAYRDTILKVHTV